MSSGPVVGVDVQSIAEVESSLRTFGLQYVNRLFDPEDIVRIRTYPSTAPAYLAGRFAAREAVLKLLEMDDAIASWHDVRIKESHPMALEVVLTNRCMIRARQRGIAVIHLGIDYAGSMAIAVAVADVADADREELE